MFDKLSISIYNETLLSLMFDKFVYIMNTLSLMFDKLSTFSIYIIRHF